METILTRPLKFSKNRFVLEIFESKNKTFNAIKKTTQLSKPIIRPLKKLTRQLRSKWSEN